MNSKIQGIVEDIKWLNKTLTVIENKEELIESYCCDILEEQSKSNKENEPGKEKLEAVAQADDLIDSLYFGATPEQSKIIISVTRDLAELDKLLKEENVEEDKIQAIISELVEIKDLCIKRPADRLEFTSLIIQLKTELSKETSIKEE